MRNITISIGSAALIGVLHFSAYAAPNINVTGSPPWTSFSVEDSNQIVFFFERNPSQGNSTISLDLPAGGANFTFEKDGNPCAIGSSLACGGSDVVAFSSASGNIQVVNISEGTTNSLFEVKIVSTVTGNWQVDATANASIQRVHTLPVVDVVFPSDVPSGETGNTVDATGSHSMYEPTASAPAVAFDWQQTAGPTVTLTPSAGGDSVTFDAPSVTVATNLGMQLSVNDGEFTAVRPLAITVQPPNGEIPVGGIVPYAGRPDDLPENWTVCDGKTISDSASPFDGQTVPDLRGMFLRGVDATHARDTIGGQDSDPVHSHAIPAHSHSLANHRHALPSHSHALGSHTHSAPSHAHTAPTHAHSLPSHAHSLPSHAHASPPHTHSLPGHAHSVPRHLHSAPNHVHTMPSHRHYLASHRHTAPTHAHYFNRSGSVSIPNESVNSYSNAWHPAKRAHEFEKNTRNLSVKISNTDDPWPKQSHSHIRGTAYVSGNTYNAGGSTSYHSGYSGYTSGTSSATAGNTSSVTATTSSNTATIGNTSVTTSAVGMTSRATTGTSGSAAGTTSATAGTTGSWEGTSATFAGTSGTAPGSTGGTAGSTGDVPAEDNRPRFYSLHYIIRIK